MLRSFQIAFGFLTIFQVRLDPIPDMCEVGRAAWAFPMVGALLGVLIATLNSLLTAWFPVPVAAIMVVGTWIVLSGGLHLDGWCDCWDALAASVPPQRRLEILKDSRMGTFGALALILLLALKISAVASGLSATILILAPMLSRSLMVWTAARTSPRGEGMGAMFFQGLDRAATTKALAISVIPAVIAGWTGLAAAGVALLAATWFMRFAEARLETVNGDVLGAVCELSETVVLVVACTRM